MPIKKRKHCTKWQYRPHVHYFPRINASSCAIITKTMKPEKTRWQPFRGTTPLHCMCYHTAKAQHAVPQSRTHRTGRRRAHQPPLPLPPVHTFSHALLGRRDPGLTTVARSTEHALRARPGPLVFKRWISWSQLYKLWKQQDVSTPSEKQSQFKRKPDSGLSSETYVNFLTTFYYI